MTQKQLLESVLSELVHIKKHMPNGELKQMQKDVEALKQDMSDLKYTLLNPEDGVIVKTNQNTFFRRRLEENEKDFSSKMLEVKDLKKWKDGVIKLISEVIKLS
jgi:predicted  nucleic acid-binding Zn-ribbon protein